MRIHDISLTLTPHSVTWYDSEPGYAPEWPSRMDAGAVCNISKFSMGSHTGTHIDAPLHFVANGGTVENLDLKVLIGPCLVAEVPHLDHPSVEATDLDALAIPSATERLLLKTSNSTERLLDRPKFQKDFVAIGPTGAEWLVNRGMKFVGVDYLSVGSAADGSGVMTHQILLGAGLIAAEGLVLSDVEPGEYTLVCLPLKLAGAEGAPMRTVLVSNWD